MGVRRAVVFAALLAACAGVGRSLLSDMPYTEQSPGLAATGSQLALVILSSHHARRNSCRGGSGSSGGLWTKVDGAAGECPGSSTGTVEFGLS